METVGNSFLPCETRLFEASVPSKRVDFPSSIAVENFSERWETSRVSPFSRPFGTPWHVLLIFPQAFSTGKVAKDANVVEKRKVFHRRGTGGCQQGADHAPLGNFGSFSTAGREGKENVFHGFSTGVENGVEKWKKGVESCFLESLGIDLQWFCLWELLSPLFSLAEEGANEKMLRCSQKRTAIASDCARLQATSDAVWGVSRPPPARKKNAIFLSTPKE